MNISKFAKELRGKSKLELGKMMDGIIDASHQQGSTLIGKMMLADLKFSYEKSQLFKTSEEQVDSFLDKYPSMIMYRAEIIDKARKFRKENGLPE